MQTGTVADRHNTRMKSKYICEYTQALASFAFDYSNRMRCSFNDSTERVETSAVVIVGAVGSQWQLFFLTR